MLISWTTSVQLIMRILVYLSYFMALNMRSELVHQKHTLNSVASASLFPKPHTAYPVKTVSSIKEMTHKDIQYENDEDAPGGPSTSGKNIPRSEHRYDNDLDRL